MKIRNNFYFVRYIFIFPDKFRELLVIFPANFINFISSEYFLLSAHYTQCLQISRNSKNFLKFRVSRPSKLIS
jgi:hypothetical protein